MEAETLLKNIYPEDYQIKRLQRMADAKYNELGGCSYGKYHKKHD